MCQIYGWPYSVNYMPSVLNIISYISSQQGSCLTQCTEGTYKRKGIIATDLALTNYCMLAFVRNSSHLS